jgi:hypothetical protein
MTSHICGLKMKVTRWLFYGFQGAYMHEYDFDFDFFMMIPFVLVKNVFDAFMYACLFLWLNGYATRLFLFLLILCV